MSVTYATVGAVTPTSARVCGEATGTSARLAVADNPGMAGPVFSSADTIDGSGAYQLQITGLDVDTPYWWQVEIDSVLDTAWSGQLRTDPTLGEPASYVFAAAGDSGSQSGPDTYKVVSGTNTKVSSRPVFDIIRTHPALPRFFLHLGDLHYRDIATNSLTLYRDALHDVVTFNGTLGADSPQGKLYRTIPWWWVWDDHDFGPDNSDRTHVGAPSAQATYRERIPHHVLAEANAIYHSHQVGRVLYIMTDSRSARDPNGDPQGPSKTMLGTAQKTWMDNLLATSDAEALVWVMPSQWLGIGGDTWASFTDERAELGTMLGDRGWLDKTLMLSADIHELGIETGTNNLWGGFPIFHFAALDSGGGAPHLRYDTGFSSPGVNRYGTVAIHDGGSDGILATGTAWIGTSTWKQHTVRIGAAARTVIPAGNPSHVLAL